MRSSFVGGLRQLQSTQSRNDLTMYDSTFDPPSSPELNAWSVLANTERWICRTLADSNASANSSAGSGTGGGGGNPYTRKEVSYSCETSTEGSMIVAGIFRRLKDARQLGESHGAHEESQRLECLLSKKIPYRPHTLRKTEVIVIPSHAGYSQSFTSFDRLIEAINQARRNARDYVTDVALEKIDERLGQSSDSNNNAQPREWSVSVNCAHLHPQFGQLTPEQELQQLREEEATGEVDVNYKLYKEKKLEARRSPYPTIVIEVRSIPPPDFDESPPPPPPPAAALQDDDNVPASSAGKVSLQDIQKLEALFGKSAHLHHPTKGGEPEEDAFYRAIEESFEKSFTALRPVNLAQQWVAVHDPHVTTTASFTEMDTPDVDAAYEFVFTNVAMMTEGSTSQQYYLVMPRFLSSAATSFEKFSTEVTKILACIIPDSHITVTTFHPEHIDSNKRSPCPILKLEWGA